MVEITVLSINVILSISLSSNARLFACQLFVFPVRAYGCINSRKRKNKSQNYQRSSPGTTIM